MASIALPVGFLVGAVVAGLVYVDASRRDLRRPTPLLSAGIAGVASLGGFLLSSLFDEALYRAYFVAFKSAAVVTSPFELLVVELAGGGSISAGSVLLYGLGSRYGRFGGE